MRQICLLLATAGLLGAQPVSFEVATIKPAEGAEAETHGVTLRAGMSIDNAMVTITNMSLMDLINAAYKVKPFQVSGPDWMAAERFNIIAKIPADASKDRVAEMLQALLADRFQVTVHREAKEQSIYALVVGKGGSKLKESPPPPPSVGDAIDSGPQRSVNRMTMQNGHMQMLLDRITMPVFAETISRFVDKPIVDMTELKGTYEMSFEVGVDEVRNMVRSQGLSMPPAMSDVPSDRRALRSFRRCRSSD